MTRVLLIGGPHDGEWREVDDRVLTLQVGNFTYERLPVWGGSSWAEKAAASIFRLHTITPEQALAWLLAGYKKGSGE